MTKNILFNPFENADAVIFRSIYLDLAFDLDYAAIVITLALIPLGLLLGFWFSCIDTYLVPTYDQYAFEEAFLELFDTIGDAFQNAGEFYLPFLFILFITVNILTGVAPFLSSELIAVQLAITFVISLLINIISFTEGLKRKGIAFFKIFVPQNVPKVILPLLIPTEIFSYILRSFSLPLRIFANTICGHVLSHLSFSVVFGSIEGISLNLISGLSLFTFVFFVEILVSYLQTYVFFTLSTVYLKEGLE